jgi:hypothetical protein
LYFVLREDIRATNSDQSPGFQASNKGGRAFIRSALIRLRIFSDGNTGIHKRRRHLGSVSDIADIGAVNK